MTPTNRIIAALEDHGCEPNRSDNTCSSKCPAHDDHNPSLSVSDGDNGGAVLRCHRGCEPEAVVAALGMTMADLMPEESGPTPGKHSDSGRPRTVATYDYRDENVREVRRRTDRPSSIKRHSNLPHNIRGCKDGFHHAEVRARIGCRTHNRNSSSRHRGSCLILLHDESPAAERM